MCIRDRIRTMHDRSNGLGGGFAGYGIYPEYADYYAFHVFYDTQAAKETCEKEIERHFDIVNLSKIPTRQHPRITDAGEMCIRDRSSGLFLSKIWPV